MTAEMLPPDRQPVIIAARRTPVCRTNGVLQSLRAHELLAPVLRELLAETGAEPGRVTDVVIGNAVGGGGNVARLALLEAGLPVSVPGITVDRQCGSGLDAVVLASRLVAAGGNPLYLAGGVESTSTAPLRAYRNDDGGPEFYARAQFVPAGFGDPDMGVAAENVAREFGVSRERQDAFALRSHRLALAARDAGVFDGELATLDTEAGTAADDGPRRGLNAAVLARFPAAFVDGGTVTAGNSCFDADAASAVVITSLQRARTLGAVDGLLVLGSGTAGVDPELLGVGAAAAARDVLSAAGVSADQVDLVEFNEAFASQTLACLDQVGIDAERANLDGGALALGHAYGASGAVLVTRLLAQARRSGTPGSLALAMISSAGGMGTAALLEYQRL
ncbi:acetyl-CoA C-acetyltransferase [Pseudarthrobacter oxydans]|uniref:Acetyl-CoA C-acetyltransferase n=1 Tax=Pseudarthrobacter oxydans TaxID=1671 RepID=A0AAW8NB03_PSEOX|nr:thiolase family protein [Pseudarthrobacter oxydans]MDR6792111.1 acetyl-CoA C-acetyltransferase [Pseudarthrobacter oxydans]MDR7163529.1 acetyl-CoA C-acetyltransferase [Pseudarthrobacter oxydans]